MATPNSRRSGQARVQIRFCYRYRSRHRSAGIERRRYPADFGKKNEPEFMLEWRLKAYRHWAKLEKIEAEPKWANVHYPAIDYQAIRYYSAPKTKADGPKSLDRSRSGVAQDLCEARHSPRWNRRSSPASPSTLCLTACRWRRRSKGSSPRWALFFVHSRKRCTIIPSWFRNISARWCLTPTIFSPRSMPRSLPTVLFVTFRRACDVRWSCRLTSASTPPKPASSSAR